MLHTDSSLLLSSECVCSIVFAAVSALNIYMCTVQDLNGLDAYTSCTVHEQDSVVARHERTNYTHAIVCMLYNI